MLSVIATLVLFILIAGGSMFIHELGHFLAARLTGMRVEEFAIGRGPTLWSWKRGDTRYLLKPFPIGAYVKIYGEENRTKAQGSFSEKSIPARLLVVIAGVVMNFLLAIVVMYVVLIVRDFRYSGIPYYEGYDAWFGNQDVISAYNVTALGVVEDSPSDEAGLTAPFEILSVSGESIESVEELREELSGFKGKEVTLSVRDLDEETGAAVGNVEEVRVTVSDEGTIGVELAPDVQVVQISYEGAEKPLSGVLHSLNMTQANFFILGRLISQSVAEQSVAPVAETVAGPVGLYAIVDLVRQYGGLIGLLDFIALLNLGLALIQVIPFPALDGSHVVLLGIEAVRRKPVSEKVQNVMFTVGMVLLLVFAAAIAVKDVVQFWF